jgi:hypothetical protein
MPLNFGSARPAATRVARFEHNFKRRGRTRSGAVVLGPIDAARPTSHWVNYASNAERVYRFCPTSRRSVRDFLKDCQGPVQQEEEQPAE